MMMSSLSAPDLDLAKEQLSIDLQQAQTLVLTDPARCVQITSAFLTRTANNPKQIISNRQEYGYREPLLSYGTAAQATGAHLLKGSACCSLASSRRPRSPSIRASPWQPRSNNWSCRPTASI